MGTRSSITVHNPETGKHVSVYCHWDGYIDHNGRMLLNHYNNFGDAYALVNGGSISSLDKSINCPSGHSFDNKAEGYTVFYMRDRGERGAFVEPIIYKSLEACMKRTSQGYDYLYRDGEWWVHMWESDENGDGIYDSRKWKWMRLSKAVLKLDAGKDEYSDSFFCGIKNFK